MEWHPREVRWTVTPSEVKVSDNTDSSKTFIILSFLFVLWILLDFFFHFLFSFCPPYVVVVDFIGTKKSN